MFRVIIAIFVAFICFCLGDMLNLLSNPLAWMIGGIVAVVVLVIGYVLGRVSANSSRSE